MRDIESKEDLVTIIDHFYKKVLQDEIIGTFFTETVVLDWNKHIPIMYDFWETTLLGGEKYKANAMKKHMELNAKRNLKEHHFQQWLTLWEESVNQYHEGEIANLAIQRAQQIGDLMKYKINSQFK